MPFRYYRLLDKKYNGTIVKKNSKTCEEFYYNFKTMRWEPIGIMIRYFWPESETFEMYEEITETQSLNYLNN